jgi:hypothetical protein
LVERGGLLFRALAMISLMAKYLPGNIQKNVGKVKAGFGDLKEDLKKDN